MKNIYVNTAQEAFEQLYDYISDRGEWFGDTRAIFNCGIQINSPLKNRINTEWRKWSYEYAKNEWKWYLSGDPKISKLGEIHGSIPQIWHKMQDQNGEVNSNYGWQWNRNNQLAEIIEELRENPNSRRAAISIYDGKEIIKYNNDTPCTYAVQFTIHNNKLNMSVYMRSNDLWFGFCNDQYCFSELQLVVADELNLPVGNYYHHAHNMHIYKPQLNRK